MNEGESYPDAASRETREETGLRVEIISLVLEGKSGKDPAKTYFGRIAKKNGGKLRKFPTRECLNARFVRHSKIDHSMLAFERDSIALNTWRDMKDKHRKAKRSPLPDACPYCGSPNVHVRYYPQHDTYRCRDCDKVFADDA